jgi:hypothetical protein
MFVPNQVGEILIGNAVATETTVPTFITSASDKELKVLSKDGTNVAAKKPFYILQKADAIPGGFEFSDKVDPKYVEKVTVTAYSPEVQGSYKIDGFNTAGVVAAKRTYEVEIRLEDQLSPENFTTIQGYYVTGQVLGSDTATTVRNGVLLSLNKNLSNRGNDEFTAVADGTGILITEKYQANRVGRDTGRKLRFTVKGKVFENVPTSDNGSNLNLLTTTQITAPKPGTGTGKWVTNAEYVLKGFKYDPSREYGYPANFGNLTPTYASTSGIYNLIHIKHYVPNTSVDVEHQYKVLTIAVEKTADTLANNANTNAILTSIRTAVDTFATVPANLAVV